MSVNTKVNGQLVKSAGLYSVTAPIGMADIYSTEEKEVGLWIDNKPLYSKTIHFGALPNNTTKTVAHNISNLDYIVNIVATAKNNAGAHVPIPQTSVTSAGAQFAVSADLSDIYISTGQDRSSLDAYVTIFYTKTTDTPWSGKFVPQGYGYVSSGDIYSFEERQVGVWADGKPLYQKTLYIASLPSSKSTGTYSLNVSNAENCWVVDANSGTGNLNMIRVAESSVNDMQSASVYVRCGVVDGDAKVYVEVGRDRSSMSAYVTVRYTKTTDVAGSGEYVPSGDKAEHYSTDEEVIGTFMGETLYRKTFVFNTAIQCASQTWTTLTGAVVNNVSKIINSFTEDANGTLFIPTGTNITNNTFGVLFTRNSAINVNTFTVEYTKTS